MALQGDEWLWVATTDSSLHKWPARERVSTKSLQRASSFVAGSLPFARARANLDGSAPVCYAVHFSQPYFCQVPFVYKDVFRRHLKRRVPLPGLTCK